MVREEVLNTELSKYLSKGISRALNIPESYIKVSKVSLGSDKGKYRFPDIRLVDIFGLRIVIQGKIENLDDACNDCKTTIEEGLCDLCFGVSYPKKLSQVQDIRDLGKDLETSVLKISLVKPPNQLTLSGWPANTRTDLGEYTPKEFVKLLEQGTLYDQMLGDDIAEGVSQNISDILDRVRELQTDVKLSIEERLSKVLSVEIKEKGQESKDIEAEDDESDED